MQALDQRGRLADHPAVDRLDQSELLGDVEERARRNQLAAVAGQAYEQLVVGDLVLADVEDRLLEELEAVLFERRANPLGPGEAGAHLRLRPLRRVEQHAAVAAGL